VPASPLRSQKAGQPSQGVGICGSCDPSVFKNYLRRRLIAGCWVQKETRLDQEGAELGLGRCEWGTGTIRCLGVNDSRRAHRECDRNRRRDNHARWSRLKGEGGEGSRGRNPAAWELANSLRQDSGVRLRLRHGTIGALARSGQHLADAASVGQRRPQKGKNQQTRDGLEHALHEIPSAILKAGDRGFCDSCHKQL